MNYPHRAQKCEGIQTTEGGRNTQLAVPAGVLDSAQSSSSQSSLQPRPACLAIFTLLLHGLLPAIVLLLLNPRA